jgi:ribosomal protein S18 acetylase RimI-like enzyme
VKKPSAKRPAQPPSATARDGPSGIAIRPARPADLLQIVALDAEITGLRKREYWQGLIERTSRPRQPEGLFLVAEGTLDGSPAVLGFIEGEIRAWEFGSAPCGWVYVLSVRPDARLQGLGQVLLDALAAAFKRAGVGRMRTMVLRNNRLVMQFFRAAGMMAGPYLELEKEIE